jgi:hypothetical protein
MELFKTPTQLENGMQRQLIRAVDRISLDASGNISSFLLVRNCELQNKYLRLFDMFTEVKVLALKVTYVPSTVIRNTSLAMGALFTSVRHDDYTSLQTIGDTLVQTPNVKVHCMADPKPITVTWHKTPGDAEEDIFYNAGGTSIGHIIPRDLGGVVFWSDGPVASAGTYIGDIYSEWSLLYRGMRND